MPSHLQSYELWMFVKKNPDKKNSENYFTASRLPRTSDAVTFGLGLETEGDLFCISFFFMETIKLLNGLKN